MVIVIDCIEAAAASCSGSVDDRKCGLAQSLHGGYAPRGLGMAQDPRTRSSLWREAAATVSVSGAILLLLRHVCWSYLRIGKCTVPSADGYNELVN